MRSKDRIGNGSALDRVACFAGSIELSLFVLSIFMQGGAGRGRCRAAACFCGRGCGPGHLGAARPSGSSECGPCAPRTERNRAIDQTLPWPPLDPTHTRTHTYVIHVQTPYTLSPSDPPRATGRLEHAPGSTTHGTAPPSPPAGRRAPAARRGRPGLLPLVRRPAAAAVLPAQAAADRVRTVAGGGGRRVHLGGQLVDAKGGAAGSIRLTCPSNPPPHVPTQARCRRRRGQRRNRLLA